VSPWEGALKETLVPDGAGLGGDAVMPLVVGVQACG
jgi:hypothetical protein